MKTLLVLAGLFAGGCTFAQKRIYFCEDYTPAGEPVKTSSVWNINPVGGGMVYMLYQNDGATISSSSVSVRVDKLSGKEYKEFDTKNIVPEKDKTWVIYDYKFIEPGEYKVTFTDAAKPLATEYVTIQYIAEAQALASKLTADYYTEAKVIFCESVDPKGFAQTPSSVFNIPPSGGGFVYVLVDHIKPLKTKELIVDIWDGEGYKDFVETKRFTVEDSWEWADFKYTFYKAGNYKFAIYNKDEVYIQTGYVSIDYK